MTRTDLLVMTLQHLLSQLAQKIKEENGGGEVVVVDDGHEKGLNPDELEVFNEHLPIASKKVKAAAEVEADEKEDVRIRKEIKLYRCSDEDGTLKVSEVKTGPLLQSDLDPKDSFIVDNGECGIWVWVGKKASQKERTEAMRNAQGFIKKKGYKPHTPVTRVVDNGEPSEFKSLFKVWKDKDAAAGMGKKYVGNRGVAKVVQTKFDATTLHENPKVAAETRMVDDGKGAKEVFRVDNFDLLQVPEEEHGKFYSGDCYIVLYAYSSGSRDHYLIYYWLVSTSIMFVMDDIKKVNTVNTKSGLPLFPRRARHSGLEGRRAGRPFGRSSGSDSSGPGQRAAPFLGHLPGQVDHLPGWPFLGL